MTTALMDAPMPKTNKPKRNDKSVKIARDLAVKAKFIAETKGVTIAEYLTDLLRQTVEKDWSKAVSTFKTLGN